MSFDCVRRRVLPVLVCIGLTCVPAEAQNVAFQDVQVNAVGRTIDLLLLTPLSVPLVAELGRAPVADAWSAVSHESATGLTRALTIANVVVDPALNIVTLQLDPATDAAWLNPATHVIAVTYLRSRSLPRAVWPVAAPGSVAQGRFQSAPTAQAADVYFSGKITAADAAKPKYSFEAKIKKDWPLGASGGAAGFSAEGAADEEVNIDPDRIALTSTYRRVIDAGNRGSILHVQPAGGEFARKAPRTRTFLSSATIEHVLVPTTGGPAARVALLVYGGVEVGSNLSNALNKEDGSGGIARVRIAPNPYFVFQRSKGLFKVFKASALWDVRFLANEEIDPGRLDAAQQPTLTRRTRQHLKVDFDIGVNDFVSLTLQHRQGYLPPAYKKVNSSLALTLTFKGKWV